MKIRKEYPPRSPVKGAASARRRRIDWDSGATRFLETLSVLSAVRHGAPDNRERPYSSGSEGVLVQLSLQV